MNNTTETPWQDTASKVLSSILCPLGIISSFLVAVSLQRKVFREKNLFFTLMFIISCLDLLFNCGYFYLKYADPVPDSIMSSVLFWLVYSASLTSDLCTLALT